MMTSFLNNIPVIVQAAVSIKPKKILDIGAGFGKFGLLIREALLSLQAEAGSMYPVAEFQIDACESSPYFNQQKAFGSIYDIAYPQDVREIATPLSLAGYDLYLLIDVIEHWPKEDFFTFLKNKNPNTKILVSTPKEVVFYDPNYYGIDKHMTQFTYEDFLMPGVIDYSTEDSFIFLI